MGFSSAFNGLMECSQQVQLTLSVRVTIMALIRNFCWVPVEMLHRCQEPRSGVAITPGGRLSFARAERTQ
jgi:hypothetical protein